MSIGKAKQFLETLKSDEALAEQADDAYVAALMKVAAQAGMSLSEDELRQVLDGGANGLSDEEMGQVVGAGTLGGNTFNTVFGGGATFNTATDFQFQFTSFSSKGFSKT